MSSVHTQKQGKWYNVVVIVIKWCFYLLLNQGWAGLSGMLLGHLWGNAHLLLDLLLVLLLLLLLLFLLCIGCLLHMLQPELGQVNLSGVFARVTLCRWNGRSCNHNIGWLRRWRWFLNYQITYRKKKMHVSKLKITVHDVGSCEIFMEVWKYPLMRNNAFSHLDSLHFLPRRLGHRRTVQLHWPGVLAPV